ncbi:MAG: TlpA family protein disulfide reductase [Pseudomonadales bacterium]|nr:TlpA family protein disulfide reductase [Pseudomonadales bacterium]
MNVFNKAPVYKGNAPHRISPIIAGALLLCVLLLLSSCTKPDFTDTAGQTGRFQDFQGKWLVINYWAEWCEPCREEIPEFNLFAKQHADTTEVFAISYDSLSAQELAEQANRMGIEFRVLTQDPSVFLGFKKPQVLPATYIFKPDGSFYKELLGPQTQESLENLLFGSK